MVYGDYLGKIRLKLVNLLNIFINVFYGITGVFMCFQGIYAKCYAQMKNPVSNGMTDELKQTD